MKRTLGVGLAALSLTLGSVVLTAPQAAAAVAPSCVKHIDSGRSWGFPWVKIRNDCKSTQRVKIIWAFAPDRECKTLAPGKTFKHSTGVAGRFDGIRSC
ncbi:MAG: hypothetical protein QM711_17275 [Micropruina sp.]|uniref:hypothetical protein n=1 Tax=Micropruina sp. TaxID=2737536 RepID=UPI0039E4376A